MGCHEGVNLWLRRSYDARQKGKDVYCKVLIEKDFLPPHSALVLSLHLLLETRPCGQALTSMCGGKRQPQLGAAVPTTLVQGVGVTLLLLCMFMAS